MLILVLGEWGFDYISFLPPSNTINYNKMFITFKF